MQIFFKISSVLFSLSFSEAFTNFPIVRELEMPLNALRGIRVEFDDFPCLEVSKFLVAYSILLSSSREFCQRKGGSVHSNNSGLFASFFIEVAREQ